MWLECNGAQHEGERSVSAQERKGAGEGSGLVTRAIGSKGEQDSLIIRVLPHRGGGGRLICCVYLTVDIVPLVRSGAPALLLKDPHFQDILAAKYPFVVSNAMI